MFNNKILFIFFILITFLFDSGCGKKKIEAGSPEEVLSFVREKGNSETVFDFYTDETLTYMKKYVKLTGMQKETSVDILSFIPEGAEYNVSGKTVEGNKCNLNIVFTKHSSENGMGQVVALQMIKEGNSWKIDRAEDFKKLIKSYERKGTDEYLNKIK